MTIPRETVEAIRERADLVEIVSQVVTLKRRGSSYVGLCPFHQEKSPSFNVVPDKGFYHCFGCGEGGDVFTFLQKTRGLEFGEAVRELATQVGITIEERRLTSDERRRMSVRRDLYACCAAAADWFHGVLMTRPEGREAREYLRDRGIDDETIRSWRLGLAPDSWDALLTALHRQGFDADLVVSAGLAKAREGGRGAYALFRGRVMVPIEDPRGRVVAFGGRVLGGGGPKYVNSPETPIYKKSEVLFGLARARSAIQRNDRILVVEGYFDVLSLHQAGFSEAVATCGTALTGEHIKLIRPLTRTVVALFDADEAGMRAATRSLELFLEADIEPRRLDLRTDAEGPKDPDEFIRARGPEAFETLLRNSEPLFELVLRQAINRHGATPGGRSRTLEDLAPLVRRHGPLTREALITRLSSALGLPEAAVRGKVLGHRTRAVRAARGGGGGGWRGTPELRHLLWLLLHYPDQVAGVVVDADPEWVSDRPGALRAVGMLLDGRRLTEVVEALDDPDLVRLLRAAAARQDLYPADRAAAAARQIVARMEENWIRQRLVQLENDIRACASGGDRSRIDELLRRRQELQHRMKTLKHRSRRDKPA